MSISRSGASSNEARGDAFRDRIFDICVAAGYKPVKEFKIRGKDVDCLFEVDRLPRKSLIAIEAKFYKENLSKKTADEIIGSYKAAIERREITEVWIVTDKDFTAEARYSLDQHSGFFAVPYTEFISNMINFPRYIEYLQLQIDHEIIDEYYINQNILENGDAITFLTHWNSKDIAQPVAILSPYGMGKSSLARKFASELIKKWRLDKSERIPIFIKLGELSSQQQIEGLIGCLFTKDIQVGSYSFPLFQKLNELGHFCIILDGLDEMRHAMTWDDFKYNFSQISKIILPRTNCLMLGRPNTFQTAKEFQSVIHGKRFIGDQEVIAANALRFLHCELESFGPSQMDAFFASFLTYLLRGTQTSDPTIRSRVLEIKALGMDALFARPVHAKMMGEIASDLNVVLKKFSRCELYENFITLTLERDFGRHQGTGISPDQRRTFLERLAWENWINERDAFQASQVDRAWFGHFDPSIDADGLRRELLSGSIIETKLGDVFYFSHRTFQEFLVAEFVVNYPETAASNLELISTPEVLDFINESNNRSRVLKFFDHFTRTNIYSADRVEELYPIYVSLVKDGLVSINDQSDPTRWTLSHLRRLDLNPETTAEQIDEIFDTDGATLSWEASLLPFYLSQFVGNALILGNEATREKIRLSNIKKILSKMPFDIDRMGPDFSLELRNDDPVEILQLAGFAIIIKINENHFELQSVKGRQSSMTPFFTDAAFAKIHIQSFYGPSVFFSKEQIEKVASPLDQIRIKKLFDQMPQMQTLTFKRKLS